MIKNIAVLGVFGGASLNSVELMITETDGLDIYDIKKTANIPYPEPLVQQIHNVVGHRISSYEELCANADVQKLQSDMSDFYAETIREFCAGEKVDEIGVDSLTIYNNPEEKCSYQLEKGNDLSKKLGRRIVTHFHKADLLSGGQASPLVPSFYNLMAQYTPKPVLFINIDAVTSLTYVGEFGELIAFDCAAGMAMIEDWAFRHANMLTDYNGRLGISGEVNQQVVDSLLHHKLVRKTPPKSIDIMDFSDKREHLEGLSLEDGCATTTAFIAQAVYQACHEYLPQIPNEIYIAGEGLKNPTLLRFLRQTFADYELKNLTEIHHRLKSVGAMITAFNTARRIYALPLTYPTTTGVFEPMIGGEIYGE